MHTHERALHIISHSLLAASTLREAYEILLRYAPALSDALQLELKEKEDRGYLVLSCHCEGDIYTRFWAEYALAVTLNMARSISAQQRPMTEVWFAHPPPAYQDRYGQTFGCPILFDRPANALVFARELLDSPHPHADPGLSAVMRKAADQLLIEPSLRCKHSQRVREALRYEHDLGDVNLDRLARRFGMTRRALRRRLRNEGTALAELLNEARFREARKELARPDSYQLPHT